MLCGGYFSLLSFLSVELLTKAIRSADKFENRCSMSEPIKQSSGHTLIAAQDTTPLSKTQVGCDDERHPLIEGGTLLLIMRPSLPQSSNQTTESIRCIICIHVSHCT